MNLMNDDENIATQRRGVPAADALKRVVVLCLMALVIQGTMMQTADAVESPHPLTEAGFLLIPDFLYELSQTPQYDDNWLLTWPPSEKEPPIAEGSPRLRAVSSSPAAMDPGPVRAKGLNDPWAVTVDPSPGFDTAVDVAVDDSGVYVVGHVGISAGPCRAVAVGVPWGA